MSIDYVVYLVVARMLFVTFKALFCYDFLPFDGYRLWLLCDFVPVLDTAIFFDLPFFDFFTCNVIQSLLRTGWYAISFSDFRRIKLGDLLGRKGEVELFCLRVSVVLFFKCGFLGPILAFWKLRSTSWHYATLTALSILLTTGIYLKISLSFFEYSR